MWMQSKDPHDFPSVDASLTPSSKFRHHLGVIFLPSHFGDFIVSNIDSKFCELVHKN